MGKDARKKAKNHIIPYDMVFKPDPFEGLEDTRPVEVRKRNKPNKSVLWSDLKDEIQREGR